MTKPLLRLSYLNGVFQKEYQSFDITTDETRKLLKEIINEKFNHLNNTRNIVVILDDVNPIYIYGFTTEFLGSTLIQELEDHPNWDIRLFQPDVFDLSNDYFLPTEVNYNISNLSLIITPYEHLWCIKDMHRKCTRRYLEIVDNELFENVNVYLCIMHLITIVSDMMDLHVENQLCEKILQIFSHNNDIIDNIAKKYPNIKNFF